jgi:hypothetical protein
MSWSFAWNDRKNNRTLICVTGLWSNVEIQVLSRNAAHLSAVFRLRNEGLKMRVKDLKRAEKCGNRPNLCVRMNVWR